MKAQERSGKELDQEILQIFADQFIPRWDSYPIQNSDGSYTGVKWEALTLAHVEKHIRGQITLGAYALNPDSRARWICLDADEPHEWDGLKNLAEGLGKKRVPAYLEPSRRGGHLWLFLTPLSGRDVRRFGKQLLKEHNLETVELYPKQDELRTGPGSLVRLPLGIHRKDGRRYHFVTTTGEPLAPTIREQIAVLANPARVPQPFVKDVLKRAPKTKQHSPTARFEKRDQVTGDTPAEKIKNAISVYDFVSHYVQLDRGGRGLCPFHEDHRESFSIDQERNYWHCFAGCEGQTVIDFWMKWNDVDFKQAVKELAGMLLPPLT